MNLEYAALALLPLIERALIWGHAEDHEEVRMAGRSIAAAAYTDSTWQSFGYDWLYSTDAGARWSRAKAEIMSYHLLALWGVDSKFVEFATDVRADRGADPRVLAVSTGLLAGHVSPPF
jgi:hypothetical protein